MTASRPVAAMVLAAGLSRRFGDDNKLLEPLGETTIIAATTQLLATAGAAPVLVVTGHDVDAIVAAVAGPEIRCHANPAFADGMGTSIAAGVRALEDDAIDGVLIALGDMPFVRPATIAALLGAFASTDDIIVPTRDGRRGHPVLFGRTHFTALAGCTGDIGARAVLEREAAAIKIVATSDDGVLRDIDRPEDLTD